MFYDDCEFEWVAIAGPGPLERVQFHRDAPTFQMITELNMRVHYMEVVNRVSSLPRAHYSTCIEMLFRLGHVLNANESGD